MVHSPGENLKIMPPSIDYELKASGTGIDNQNQSAESPAIDAKTIPLPTPEETRMIYDAVVEKLGIVLPEGLSLGHLLARLQPRQQHLFRGICGMYPFDHPLSRHEIAKYYSLNSSTAVSVACGRVIEVVTTANIQPPMRLNIRASITLEELAIYLDTRGDMIDPLSADIVRAINGLPPYIAPVQVKDLAAQHGIPRSTISERESRAITTLRDMRLFTSRERGFDPTELPIYRRKAEMKELFRTRDAGWYAELLYRLYPPETRQQWADIIVSDLERASVLRGAIRLRATYPSSFMKMPEQAIKRSGSTVSTPNRDRLSTKRAHNRLLDTDTGRAELVKALMAEAEKLRPTDLPDLQEVISMGKDAQYTLVEGNTMLVFFLALHYRKNDSPWKTKLAAGYEGLKQAVRNFDEEVGFAFSSYAVKLIGAAINKQAEQDLGDKIGETGSMARHIILMRAAETALMQELHRQPTSAEIAERLGLVRAATVENYQRKYSRLFTIPVDETAQSVLLPQEVLKADAEANGALQDIVNKVLETVDLSTEQRTVLCGRYGLAPYDKELSDSELAAMLGCAEVEIKAIFTSARRKLTRSKKAASLLHGYLRP